MMEYICYMKIAVRILISGMMLHYVSGGLTTEEISEDSGNLTSPNYPLNYARYNDRLWEFKRILNDTDYLLIHMADVKLTFVTGRRDSLCCAELLIKGQNVCDFEEDTCFIFQPPSATCKYDHEQQWNCKSKIRLEFSEFSLYFKTKYYQPNPRRMRLQYSYGSCSVKQSAIPTTQAFTISNVSTSMTPSISESPRRHLMDDTASIAVLALCLLLGFSCIVLIVLLMRKRRKCVDAFDESSIKTQKENLQFYSTPRAYENISYEPNSDNDHDDTMYSSIERKEVSSSAGSNFQDERQIVINELYTLS